MKVTEMYIIIRAGRVVQCVRVRQLIIECEGTHESVARTARADIVKPYEAPHKRSLFADDQSERSDGVHDDERYLPL